MSWVRGWGRQLTYMYPPLPPPPPPQPLHTLTCMGLCSRTWRSTSPWSLQTEGLHEAGSSSLPAPPLSVSLRHLNVGLPPFHHHPPQLCVCVCVCGGGGGDFLKSLTTYPQQYTSTITYAQSYATDLALSPLPPSPPRPLVEAFSS